ncbi:hypothetical protein F4825DRAFT_428916 [Nemania diffusa]|nr:hypothetical protein F4825DRAFT_428916 [Nemania diffusa]
MLDFPSSSGVTDSILLPDRFWHCLFCYSRGFDDIFEAPQHSKYKRECKRMLLLVQRLQHHSSLKVNLSGPSSHGL